MDNRKKLFIFTLSFSILLEWWVRWGMVPFYGDSGFGVWPPVDNIMHFFWGLNIFLAFVLFLRWKPVEALLGVYAWQMVWEACEMIGDSWLAQPGYMLDHFFMDGFKDTLVDVGGAALGWFLLSRFKGAFKKTTEHPRLTKFLLTHLYLMLALLPIGVFLLLKNGVSPDTLTIFWIAGAVPVAWFLRKP